MALTPWRDIITPHNDVAAGRYHQAEFAVNLAEVVAGNADPEYQDPIEFFKRTYLTEGMRQLLVSAVRRLSGEGGDPIIQLKTAFGGGKTHTMLALYHLLGQQATPDQMENTERILADAGVGEVPETQIAVIVGTDPNPTVSRLVKGITIRTLWGDIAAQLGGKEGYEIVKEADEKGVAPGANDLTKLFNEYSPIVILIDELVAYARNLYNVEGLPAGSFDSNLTFIQALTEAVERSDRSQFIVSIPESDHEIGGEAGQQVLARLEAIIARLENIWRPVGPNEGFEIVRRRLFSQVKDEAARESVCSAFTKLYEDNPSDFPSECRDNKYLERLRQAYPIHPELFDRLYDDWSPLEKFQKTRGVLRLMASVIHQLWESSDQSEMILPGSIPLDAPRVREELLRYLPDGWNAVLDGDVDGDRAEPLIIDSENQRLGTLSAARRVARAIFMGSAPHGNEQNVRGLEDIRIRLGVVQPNESISVFNDATRHLENRLTHLYSRAQRYWYDTHPNLRRAMEDRAAKLETEQVEAEIVRRLRKIKDRGDFTAVHPCPTSVDVPDQPEARLVILPPTTGHQTKHQSSTALITASDILEKHGDNPRKYSNMLIFVAPDVGELDSLERETRRFLAWDSIINDAVQLNLDANQQIEADKGRRDSNESVDMRLNETYSWLLVPTQDGTNPIEWEETRIPGTQENPVAKAVKKVQNDTQLIPIWSPALLKMELDQWLWKEGSYISLKRVWDCLATYLYMPRLRDSDVLLNTVKEGVRSKEWFGYANSVGEDGKYQGLVFGNAGESIYLDDECVLVKPDAAEKQLATVKETIESDEGESKEIGGDSNPEGETKGDEGDTDPKPTPGVRPIRFYGTVDLDPIRASRDAQKVIEEVAQHLTSLAGAKVEISMEIQANVPDGVPDEVVVIISENCSTLKFTSQEFEDE